MGVGDLYVNSNGLYFLLNYRQVDISDNIALVFFQSLRYFRNWSENPQ